MKITTQSSRCSLFVHLLSHMCDDDAIMTPLHHQLPSLEIIFATEIHSIRTNKKREKNAAIWGRLKILQDEETYGRWMNMNSAAKKDESTSNSFNTRDFVCSPLQIVRARSSVVKRPHKQTHSCNCTHGEKKPRSDGSLERNWFFVSIFLCNVFCLADCISCIFVHSFFNYLHSQHILLEFCRDKIECYLPISIRLKPNFVRFVMWPPPLIQLHRVSRSCRCYCYWWWWWWIPLAMRQNQNKHAHVECTCKRRTLLHFSSCFYLFICIDLYDLCAPMCDHRDALRSRNGNNGNSDDDDDKNSWKINQTIFHPQNGTENWKGFCTQSNRAIESSFVRAGASERSRTHS